MAPTLASTPPTHVLARQLLCSNGRAGAVRRRLGQGFHEIGLLQHARGGDAALAAQGFEFPYSHRRRSPFLVVALVLLLIRLRLPLNDAAGLLAPTQCSEPVAHFKVCFSNTKYSATEYTATRCCARSHRQGENWEKRPLVSFEVLERFVRNRELLRIIPHLVPDPMPPATVRLLQAVLCSRHGSAS